MKVLHIINWLATGGAEKLIVETLPLFNETQDFEVGLALLDATDHQFYKEFKNSSPLINVHELSYSTVYNPILILKIIPLLRKYDIVHVHLFPALYWAVIAKVLSFSKVKLIFTEHSTNNRRLSNPIFRLIDRFVYRFYDQILCISPEVKNQLQRFLKIPDNKLKIVTNGINITKINSAKGYNRTEMGYSRADKTIIMVAGFRIEKDHETLIKVVKKLPEGYKLLLVGDGYRREIIESLIKQLDIESKVKLLGIRTDVYSLLKMSDIAVMSSHWEGFGLAAAEAMAAGVPLIASNVEGLAQVVGNSGVLFEKGNVEDLRKKILEVMENTERNQELVSLGYLKANNYDIKKMVNKTLEFYKCI